MPTDAELAIMKIRKNAAVGALKFFTDIHSVKSLNNPFVRVTDAELSLFKDQRENYANTIMDYFDGSVTNGLGNCDEKARVCMCGLQSHALFQTPQGPNSFVTLCSTVRFGYDHVFVIVADKPVHFSRNGVALDSLGLTAMVVDGWTEDWYFPNLNWFIAKWYSLSNTPYPRQMYVRAKITKHKLRRWKVPLFNQDIVANTKVKGPRISHPSPPRPKVPLLHI